MSPVQFLIERHCPQPWHPDPAVRAMKPDWPDHDLPLCVWVDPTPRYELLPCGVRSFRIQCELGAVSISGRHYAVDGIGEGSPTVCEHMGHLIE